MDLIMVRHRGKWVQAKIVEIYEEQVSVTAVVEDGGLWYFKAGDWGLIW